MTCVECGKRGAMPIHETTPEDWRGLCAGCLGAKHAHEAFEKYKDKLTPKGLRDDEI